MERNFQILRQLFCFFVILVSLIIVATLFVWTDNISGDIPPSCIYIPQSVFWRNVSGRRVSIADQIGTEEFDQGKQELVLNPSK